MTPVWLITKCEGNDDIRGEAGKHIVESDWFFLSGVFILQAGADAIDESLDERAMGLDLAFGEERTQSCAPRFVCSVICCRKCCGGNAKSIFEHFQLVIWRRRSIDRFVEFGIIDVKFPWVDAYN